MSKASKPTTGTAARIFERKRSDGGTERVFEKHPVKTNDRGGTKQVTYSKVIGRR